MNTLLIFVLCLLCIYSVASSSNGASYPSSIPTGIPSSEPSAAPTGEPTLQPTDEPTPNPSPGPTPGPTPEPTPGPTTATAIVLGMEQSFEAADATDFQQFMPANQTIVTASLSTTTPNPITISDSFAAILIKIVTTALQVDVSAMRVTAVYLVFIPARRMLSEDMENHRLLQAGRWEMRVEYEVIVDTMAAATQAAAAIPSGNDMNQQIETEAASDPTITIDMTNIESESVVLESVDGIPLEKKEKKDPFNKVAFGSSFPFAVIIFFSVLYLMYSPWMKTGYVNIESNVFFWKSIQRRYVEVKRGVLHAYGQGDSHHEISLGEVELITTETDQSLEPFTLQLNKVEPAGDAAYMQVTVGDSVKQSIGSTLLRIQCSSETDFQTWIASINDHIDYARSPYRQWSNYYIVNPFVSTACFCFTNSPSNSSDQELSTNRTNGKI